MGKPLKHHMEPGLSPSRLPTLIVIMLGLLILGGTLYVLAMDAGYLVSHTRQLAAADLTSEARRRLEIEIAAEAIKAFLDIYLLAVVLLIFAPGLYALIVHKSRFSVANGLEYAAWLFLTRVSDLTKWLVGVVLLRLMVRYFQKTLRLEEEGGLDFLYLAIVILLVGGALFLSRRPASH
jgi:uncharacterized membrane protein YqhA